MSQGDNGHGTPDCTVGRQINDRLYDLDHELSTKLDHVRVGVDQANAAISTLNERVLDPDKGLVVRVTDIARWRRAVDKALWIIFGILTTALLGGFFGWLVERTSQLAH